MCHALPGARCSSHTKEQVQKLLPRLNKKEEALREHTEKYAQIFDKPADELTAGEKRSLEANRKLQEDYNKIASQYEEAVINYYSSPEGQEELAANIAEKLGEGDDLEAMKLAYEKDIAAQLRTDNNADARSIKDGTEIGPEEALDNAFNAYEEAVKEELEAEKLLKELMEERRVAEEIFQKEYEEAKQHYEATHEAPLSEEEISKREKARKRKLALLIFLGTTVAGGLLAAQAAGARQSSLLGYITGQGQAALAGGGILGGLLAKGVYQSEADFAKKQHAEAVVEAQKRTRERLETIQNRMLQEKKVADRNEERQREVEYKKELRRIEMEDSELFKKLGIKSPKDLLNGLDEEGFADLRKQLADAKRRLNLKRTIDSDRVEAQTRIRQAPSPQGENLF